MSEQFRVIVAGSRYFNLCTWLCKKLDIHLSNVKHTHEVIILSGCASGADYLGEEYAETRGYAIERYPADWETHGKSAGPKRNQQMVDVANALVAFWNGKSKGTADVIRRAEAKKIPVIVHNYFENPV